MSRFRGINPADSKLFLKHFFGSREQSGDVPAVKELRNLIGEDDANTADSGQLEELIKGLQEDE
ncbi:MAG TPA: hypothetical protein DHW78_00505 [Ruminococcaceae bacterium]|jgi:hypothetical protein|nr:hypothetical protein [Oscillospiraceae bacterium]HCC01818.1 hypothetical protein [Oscillospiraceae bacterium]HCM22795.1 hypothetical protein [Oscillospiraceae bacterium]